MTKPVESTADSGLLLWDLRYRKTPNIKINETLSHVSTSWYKHPAFVYSFLSLAVMLPLLWPGYILTLDMAFTPELRMPDHMSSSYLFNASLHYLNFLVPSQIIQKLMLFFILALSGTGMYYLVRHIQRSKYNKNDFAMWGAYLAGALYMINPFSYSRFMAGQYAVLLGYALLPFFTLALMRFFYVPTLRRSLIVSFWATAIGIVSVHTLGLATIMAVVGFTVCAWRHRRNAGIILNTTLLSLAGVLVFVMSSGYWLFPLLNGESNQGQAVAQFGPADASAFQTVGNGALSKLGNVLQLQGFWAEGQGLYLLPGEQLPGWTLVVLGMWALVGAGLFWLWKNNRPIAALLAIGSIAAILLAIVGTGDWLPGAAGFREPQKFVGLLALAYSIFAGLGAAAALSWTSKHSNRLGFGLLAVAMLLAPVLITPTMFWGFSGQLSPRQYPADWYQMDSLLNQDPEDFRVLSLPWHLYMHYQFAGRVIVNPSDNFFDKPTIVSNDLEFRGASPTFPDADKKLLTHTILPGAANSPTLGKQLADLDIKYILLTKTYDYESYSYLQRRTDLRLVSETQNLRLYRNLTYGQ